jgi:hypothetical protein
MLILNEVGPLVRNLAPEPRQVARQCRIPLNKSPILLRISKSDLRPIPRKMPDSRIVSPNPPGNPIPPRIAETSSRAVICPIPPHVTRPRAVTGQMKAEEKSIPVNSDAPRHSIRSKSVTWPILRDITRSRSVTRPTKAEETRSSRVSSDVPRHRTGTRSGSGSIGTAIGVPRVVIGAVPMRPTPLHLHHLIVPRGDVIPTRSVVPKVVHLRVEVLPEPHHPHIAQTTDRPRRRHPTINQKLCREVWVEVGCQKCFRCQLWIVADLAECRNPRVEIAGDAANEGGVVVVEMTSRG